MNSVSSWLVWLLVAPLLSSAGGARDTDARNAPSPSPPARRNAPSPRLLRIAAVGDVMLGTTRVRLRARGRHLLRACKPYLKGMDVAFFNNEGTFAHPDTPPHKKAKPGLSYVFRSPALYIRWLVEAGFNMASLANNHSYDYGWKGLRETIRGLHRAGIVTSHNFGSVAKRTVRGTRIAMVAFHTSRHGKHNINNIPQAIQVVRPLAQRYDIVIVSFHGGAEGNDRLHVPKKLERFLGERRGDVYRFARAMVDAGADLILGHGPHVPRAMEIYKGRLIAYSLGNFVTTGFGLRKALGLAPLLQVNLTPTGAFHSGRVVSFRQRRYRGVVLDPQHRAAQLIHRLGRADFPTTNAVAPDGTLRLPPQAKASNPPPTNKKVSSHKASRSRPPAPMQKQRSRKKPQGP